MRTVSDDDEVSKKLAKAAAFLQRNWGVRQERPPPRGEVGDTTGRHIKSGMCVSLQRVPRCMIITFYYLKTTINP